MTGDLESTSTRSEDRACARGTVAKESSTRDGECDRGRVGRCRGVGDAVTVRERERNLGETKMQVDGGGGGGTSNNRTGRWYLSISMDSGVSRAFQSIRNMVESVGLRCEKCGSR